MQTPENMQEGEIQFQQCLDSYSNNSKVREGEFISSMASMGKSLTSRELRMELEDLLSGKEILTATPRSPEWNDVGRLRKIVDSYLSLGQPDTAVHWADKLVSLSQEQNIQRGEERSPLVAEDVHRLGRGLLATRQAHRAAHLVRSSGLHTKHLGCCHVATMALYQV